jgi:hypothetical protein
MITTKKLYRFQVTDLYRGQQIHKVCYATSYAEAARMFNMTQYHVKNYGYKMFVDELTTDDVLAFIDSGELIFEAGRKDVFRKLIPLNELTNIIDQYMDEKYKKWRESVGI